MTQVFSWLIQKDTDEQTSSAEVQNWQFWLDLQPRFSVRCLSSVTPRFFDIFWEFDFWHFDCKRIWNATEDEITFIITESMTECLAVSLPGRVTHAISLYYACMLHSGIAVQYRIENAYKLEHEKYELEPFSVGLLLRAGTCNTSWNTLQEK